MKNGIQKLKSFRTKAEAMAWAVDEERKIAILAIGGATIEGTFTGKVRFRGGFKRYFELRGTIRYKFYDKFTDPYDTFNWIKGEWNPDGTAFDIVGEWEETIRIPKLTPEQRKRLQ